MKIYYAAPWFSPEQADIHARVYNVLVQSGHDVFSPKHACEVKPGATKQQMREAFSMNLKEIGRSHVILAVTDYRDVGTIFECGYAYAVNRPIVYYAETLGDRPFNLMLAESGIAVMRSCPELLEFLSGCEHVMHLEERARSFEGRVE